MRPTLLPAWSLPHWWVENNKMIPRSSVWVTRWSWLGSWFAGGRVSLCWIQSVLYPVCTWKYSSRVKNWGLGSFQRACLYLFSVITLGLMITSVRAFGLLMESSLACVSTTGTLKAFWYHLGGISRKAREPDSEWGCPGAVPTDTAGSAVDAPRYTIASPSRGFLQTLSRWPALPVEEYEQAHSLPCGTVPK